MPTPSVRRISAALLCLTVLAPAARSQEPSATRAFHEAYYLHHEVGDLEQALPLYRRAADDASAPAAIRRDAGRFAAAIEEDLASSDFARLAPPGTILYLELDRPGAQLRELVEQLGLGADGNRFGISPQLVDGLLGIRGVAFAVTDIDPRHGPRNGVAILHPGDLGVVRGLLETALPASGQRVDPIGGNPTWRVEGQVFVTMTARLVLVSPDPAEIEAVLARLRGEGDGGLAGRESLRTAMEMRGHDLMFFCANLEPIMPMLTEAMRHEARRDPGAQAALAMLDLESTRYLAGRAGVGPDGVSLDLAVELDADHRNIAFNLMRLPPLGEQALGMVPAGAAFFWALGVNHSGTLPQGATDAEGRPVVTMLDFGREVFANVADVALFAMPTVQRTPMGPIPDAALALRVNDPARSRALWRLVLGAAQTASGRGAEVESSTRGGVAVDRYEIEGVPVFVAVDENHLVISPSEAAIGAAISSRREGRTLRQDPAFGAAIDAIGDRCVEAVALNVGRCGELAAHFMSDRERREMAPFLEMLRDTSMWLRFSHSDRRLAVHGEVAGIPDVGPMVEQLIERERGGGGRGRATVSTAPADPVDDLMLAFAQVHAAGRTDVARGLAAKIHELGRGDPGQLNDFAWALLTDAQYANAYDAEALAMAKTANEASGWANWYHLDTYAHALFRAGRVDDAIAIERKAVELGAGDPRIGEAEAALARFVAAKAAAPAAVGR